MGKADRESKADRAERLQMENRGGVRGGRNQFSWEAVKQDRHRENYLGNSVHATVGRWQQGRDLTWWTNDGKRKPDDGSAQEQRRKEIAEVKRKEQAYLSAALGLGGTIDAPLTMVSKEDIDRVLAANSNDVEPSALANNVGIGFNREAVDAQLSKMPSRGVSSQLVGVGDVHKNFEEIQKDHSQKDSAELDKPDRHHRQRSRSRSPRRRRSRTPERSRRDRSRDNFEKRNHRRREDSPDRRRRHRRD